MKNKNLNFRTLLGMLLLLGLFAMGCGPKKEKGNAREKEQTENPVTDMAHNSYNSLDWAGIYRGVLACSDCEGLKTELHLHQNNTFTGKELHLDDPKNITQYSGSFTWNDNGNMITLLSREENEEERKFKVTENGLIMVDGKGEMITDEKNVPLSLQKSAPDAALTDGRWNLFRLQGREVAKDEGRKQAYLVFQEADKRVSGNNSCNQISGTYTLKEGNRIAFSQLITTQMACMPNEIEVPFMEVLDLADNFTIKGDTLSLNKARMAPLAQFVLDYMH